ncbi:MAG: hypothetical protein Q9223_004901 [Gallowayella weberi]
MPSLIGTSRHRHSRHSSTPVKPTSHAPAVVLPPNPIEAKKISTASKAQLRPSTRLEAKSLHTPHQSNIKGVKTTKSKAPEDFDVFAYMENEDEASKFQPTVEEDDEPDQDHTSEHLETNTISSSPVSAHHPSSHYSDLEVNADQQSKQQTWNAAYDQGGSFHSDSGISMGSSSGDGDSPVQQHKYPGIRRTSPFCISSHEPSIPEHHSLNFSSEPLTVQCSAFGADVWPQLNTAPSDPPEAYYVPHTTDAPKSLEPATFRLPVTPPELSPQLPRSRKQAPCKASSVKKTGYAQLASTISSQHSSVIKPVYRKFETLNNRILLYLQDEIAELEADMERLDVAITQEEQCLGKAKHPESRRAEAKMPSQLQWQRNELIGRCMGKISVYSMWPPVPAVIAERRTRTNFTDIRSLSDQTLASYSSLAKTLSSSSHSDIKTYQKWLTKHNSITDSEASFLQHRNDLITVSSPIGQSSAPMILEYSPVTVALTILTTIIVFKFVPQFFARVIMSAVIGLALMCLISPASLVDLRLLREKRRGMGV